MKWKHDEMSIEQMAEEMFEDKAIPWIASSKSSDQKHRSTGIPKGWFQDSQDAVGYVNLIWDPELAKLFQVLRSPSMYPDYSIAAYVLLRTVLFIIL